MVGKEVLTRGIIHFINSVLSAIISESVASAFLPARRQAINEGATNIVGGNIHGQKGSL
jgi:hypothetical protein